MPRNIELKARIAGLDAARAISQRIATSHLGMFRQVDTYFHVAQGRLKLRETDGQTAVLIAYQRPDAALARGSDYLLVPVPEPALLKQALSMTLGVRAVVDKAREVFLYHNVRIHLDEVRGLGTYLEFEAVLGGEIDDSAGQEQLRWLCGEFGVLPDDIESSSYADMASDECTPSGHQ